MATKTKQAKQVKQSPFVASKEFIQAMNEWLSNDPDPTKTIERLKKKGEEQKKLSKDNPKKLMKMLMRPEEIMTFEIELKEKKRLAKKDPDSVRDLFSIPQCVVNANPEHWRDIINKKQFNKYPYFQIKPYVKRKTSEQSKPVIKE